MSITEMKITKAVTLVLLASVLGACTTGPYSKQQPRVVDQTPPPQEIRDRVVVDGRVLPLPQERNIATYSLPQERPVSPVVRNLIKKAQAQSASGNFDGAVNSLERALRIEPRNAKLWNRMADVRYSQKSWAKAVQLAAKSNTLAGEDKALRRENWYLMSNAHKNLGNVKAEQKFRNKLSGEYN